MGVQQCTVAIKLAANISGDHKSGVAVTDGMLLCFGHAWRINMHSEANVHVIQAFLVFLFLP